VQLVRSLSMKVPGLAWRVAGTGLRRVMCWSSFVVRCPGSTGCALGVSNSPRILRGSPYTSSATDACRSALNDIMQRLRRCSRCYWLAVDCNGRATVVEVG
jgi:hypothetical protein